MHDLNLNEAYNNAKALFAGNWQGSLKDNKAIIHCPLADRHSAGDKKPSAYIKKHDTKEKTLIAGCSACNAESIEILEALKVFWHSEISEKKPANKFRQRLASLYATEDKELQKRVSKIHGCDPENLPAGVIGVEDASEFHPYWKGAGIIYVCTPAGAGETSAVFADKERKKLNYPNRKIYPSLFSPKENKNNRLVFVVEGQSDAVAIAACGFSAIAACGVSRAKEASQQASLKFSLVITILDDDEAGRKAAKENAGCFLWAEDPRKIATQKGQDVLNELLENLANEAEADFPPAMPHGKQPLPNNLDKKLSEIKDAELNNLLSTYSKSNKEALSNIFKAQKILDKLGFDTTDIFYLFYRQPINYFRVKNKSNKHKVLWRCLMKNLGDSALSEKEILEISKVLDEEGENENREKLRLIKDDEIRKTAKAIWESKDFLIRKLINHNSHFHKTPEKLSVAQALAIVSTQILNNSILQHGTELIPLAHSFIMIAPRGVGKTPLINFICKFTNSFQPKHNYEKEILAITSDATPEAIKDKILNLSISRIEKIQQIADDDILKIKKICQREKEQLLIAVHKEKEMPSLVKDKIRKSALWGKAAIADIQKQALLDAEITEGYESNPLHILKFDEYGNDVLKKIKNSNHFAGMKTLIIELLDGKVELSRERVGRQESNHQRLNRVRCLMLAASTQESYFSYTDETDLTDGYNERFHFYFWQPITYKQIAAFNMPEGINAAIDGLAEEFAEIGKTFGANPATAENAEEEEGGLFGDWIFKASEEAAKLVGDACDILISPSDILTTQEHELLAGSYYKHGIRILKVASLIEAIFRIDADWRGREIEISKEAMAVAIIHEEHRIDDLKSMFALVSSPDSEKSRKQILQTIQTSGEEMPNGFKAMATSNIITQLQLGGNEANTLIYDLVCRRHLVALKNGEKGLEFLESSRISEFSTSDYLAITAAGEQYLISQ